MFEQHPHACVFDAYGTLFDVHSAVAQLRDRVGAQAEQVSASWRRKQLEYTWLRSLMGEYADFERVLADALDYALRQADIDDPALRTDLLAAYNRLDCYPEVPGVLRTLKQQGYGIAILTNGTSAMMRSCVEYSGLGEWLDDILTADHLRIYKPSPRVYELAVDRFGPPAAGISFQSANAWDIAGAAYFGLACVWINRQQTITEELPGRPLHTLSDLEGLPALLAATTD